MNQKHSLKKLSLSKKTIAILNNQDMVEMQGGTYTMLAGTCTCQCTGTNVNTNVCPTNLPDCGGGGDCYNSYNTGRCNTGGNGSTIKSATYGSCPTVHSNTCWGAQPVGCTL